MSPSPEPHAGPSVRRVVRAASLVLAGLSVLGCDKLRPDDVASEADREAPTAAEAVREPAPKPEAIPARLASTDAPETTPAVDPEQPGASPKVAAPPPGARTADERNTIDVFEAAAPATVFVTQSQVVLDRWSMRATEVPAGAGTGFIWDKQGHVVTNCHVALPNCRESSSNPKLEVTLYDKKTYPAKLVGHDRAKDIAVLAIEAPPESLVPIRRPSDDYEVRVGQKTIAIGNPFGLDHTLTTGVVSAMGREVKGVGGLTIRDMIQTDAAINPGNSGGPLLDSTGQLIGMNTMIFSSSGSSAGIGFAVPEDTITRLVPQLIRSGHPERVGIGVSVLSDREAAAFRIDGVVVAAVPSGSPAAEAGLHSIKEKPSGFELDVIVGVDDARIHNFDDLYSAFDGKKAGEKVRLTVRRFPGGDVRTADVDLVPLE